MTSLFRQDALGDRLRLMRESQDRSLQHLSNATGVSKAYLVRIETGRPRPVNLTLKTVERLAAELGCSPAWLAFGRER